MQNLSYLQIKPPEGAEFNELTFEKLLTSFLKLLKERNRANNWVSFELVYKNYNLNFYVVCSQEVVNIIKSQIYNFLTDSTVEEVEDPLEQLKNKVNYCVRGKVLTARKITYKDISSPIITGIISYLKENKKADCVYQVRLQTVSLGISRLFKSNYREIQNNYFKTSISVGSFSNSITDCKYIIKDITSIFEELNTKFKFIKFKLSYGEIATYIFERRPVREYLLQTDQIATLFYIPTSKQAMQHIDVSGFQKISPPDNLPTLLNVSPGELSSFASTTFQDSNIIFGIKRSDRNKHIYILGKSGMGKSKLMHLLMLPDIINGKGFALIDPHGDLAKDVLHYIPRERIPDTVYLDPGDIDFPFGFNLLQNVGEDYKQQVSSSFVTVFKKLFGNNWNFELEHLIRYSALALLDSRVSSLLSFRQLLSDRMFRQEIIKYIQDPVIKAFWATEFLEWSQKYENTAVNPLLNKINQFLANPYVRNIVAQNKSTIDIAEIMNTNKILILNLSKGKIGDENSAFLGSLFITKIQQVAMERARVDPETRKPFYLYVDEFQNFSTESFVNIFSEARKYNLSLTVAHQYIEQLPDYIESTIFGNVGTIIVFRTGVKDAEKVVREFDPYVKTKDITNLGMRDFYIKLSIDGKATKPYSARTIEIEKPKEDLSPQIIDMVHMRYTLPRKKVEEDIANYEQEIKEASPSQTQNAFDEPVI